MSDVVDSAVEISQLTAGYGSLAVLHDVNLSVRRGEIVSVVGPNGAGKTTLLLAIAGILRPMDGAIRFFDDDGAAPRSVQARSRLGVGFVPAGRGLFGTLTVRENLRVATRERGAVDRAAELFPRLGLLMNRRVGLLSGGEQQMLAIAMVLSNRPRLLMIDEMSMGLAPLVVRSLLPVLRSAAESDGVGVLIVEQQVAAALEVSDRVVVLRNGHIIHEAPAAVLRAAPESLTQLYLGDGAPPFSATSEKPSVAELPSRS